MPPTLPTYVPRGLVFPQPIICEGMDMYSFLIRGTRANIQALCDRYLNKPSNGAVQYRPLSEVIIITITDTKKIRSGDPKYSQLGYVPEREAAFWVQVEDAKNPGTDVSFFMPYLYVDRALAMAAGREDFGFPKEIGACQMPDDPGANGTLRVDVWAIEKFGPDATPQQKTLLSFTPLPTTPLQSIVRSIENDVAALINFIHDLVTPGDADAELDTLITALKTIAHMETPQFQTVLLKQFPDIRDGELACYQAIVTAPTSATKVLGLGLLPAYTVTVNQYDSHPVIDELGIQLNNGTTPTIMASHFIGNTTIGNGKVAFEAGPPSKVQA
jgi:Acetoacetate decarboxylase (ADC)